MSSVISITLAAEDKASAVVDALGAKIRDDLAKPGIAAFGSLSDSIEKAFAKLDVEAAQAARGVEAAFKTLGVASGASVKAQIQEAVSAYRLLRESGLASAKDLGAAKDALNAKLKSLAEGYRGMGSSGATAARAVETAFSKLGVTSGASVKAQIQEAITAYRTLRDSGLASAKDLGAAKDALKAKLKELASGYRGVNTAVATGSRAVESFKSGVRGLVAEFVGVYAAVNAVKSLVATLRDGDKAAFTLGSSVKAANREFRNTGTLEQWKARIEALSKELKIYSKTELAEAASRTVDMTKRLGLSVDQMEEVIKRTADLSAGKTELSDGVERVTSALRGEAEASEYLGLTLNEDYVKSWYAAHEAHGKAWKDLTDLEKAQIRYRIFVEQTAASQGKATESVETLDGAYKYFLTTLKDNLNANQELKAVLKELAGWFRENGQQVAGLVVDLASLTAGAVRLVVENRNILATLAGGAGLVWAFGKVSSAVAAGREALTLFISGASKMRDVIASIKAMATAGSLAAKSMALLTVSAPWMVLAAAVAYTAKKYLDAKEAQADAAKQQEIVADTAKREAEAWAELGRAHGVVISSQKEWTQLVREGTVALEGESVQVRKTVSDLNAAYQKRVRDAKAAYDEELKAIDGLKTSEAAKNLERLDAVQNFYMERSRLAHAHFVEIKEELDKSLAEGLLSEEAYQRRVSELESQQKAETAGILQEKLSLLQTHLESAKAAYEAHVREINAVENSMLSDAIARENDLSAIRQRGMSESQKQKDNLQRANEHMAESERLLAEATKLEGEERAQALEQAMMHAEQYKILANKMTDVGLAIKMVKEAYEQIAEIKTETLHDKQREAEADKLAFENLAEAVKNVQLNLDLLNKTPVNIEINADDARARATLRDLETVETSSRHTVDPDTARAEAAIDNLKEPTSSTHTVYVKKVETDALGGLAGVPRFAGGGDVFRRLAAPHIPGDGSVDDVPALLMRGEFVLRKDAVKKYGVGLLHALNSMRLPMDVLPQFAAGGLVGLKDRLRQSLMGAVPQFATGGAVGQVINNFFFGAAGNPLLPSGGGSILERFPGLRDLAGSSAGGGSASLARRARGLSRRGRSAASRLAGLGRRALLRMASGGSLDTTLADIALERQRTQEDYDLAVADAQDAHDTGLADALAEERATLADLAESLAEELTSLQEEYDAGVAEAKAAHDEAIQEASEAYQGELASWREEVAEAKKSYEAAKKDLSAWIAEQRDSGDAGVIKTTTSGISSTKSSYRVDRSTAGKAAALKFASALKEKKSELKGLESAWRAAEKDKPVYDDGGARETYESALVDLAADLKSSTAEAQSDYEADLAEAKNDAAETKADLEETLADTLADLKLDYDRTMEDLDIKEARARAEADEEKGYTISGFSQWLSKGGPVGGRGGLYRPLQFAGGGVVPAGPGAVRGADSVPALLMPDEGVLRVEAMRTVGSRAFEALNELDFDGFFRSLRPRRFAEGGVVPGGDAPELSALAGIGDGPAARGEEYSAILKLELGDRRFETRATPDTARAVARELRRLGVNVRGGQ